MAVTLPWDPKDEPVIHLQPFRTPTIHDPHFLQSIHHMRYSISCYTMGFVLAQWSANVNGLSMFKVGEAKLCLVD